MLKKLVSYALCLAIALMLCAPSFAIQPEIPATPLNYPGVDVEFTGIPDGYSYKSRVRYDADWRVSSITTGITVPVAILVGIAAPGLSIPAQILIDLTVGGIAEWIGDAMQGDVLYGYYYDTVYECDDPGIYPYIYFHHLQYYSSNNVLLYEEGSYEYALLPRSADVPIVAE